MPNPTIYKMDSRYAGATKESVKKPGQNPLSSAIHSSSSINCFGGKLLRHNDRHGNPLISHAVQAMTGSEADAAEFRYRLFNRIPSASFIRFAGSHRADDYTVFTFEIAPREQSLRELMGSPQGCPLDAVGLMRQLTALVHRYQNILTSRQEPYMPLCCLSVDTVYVSPSGTIRILPLTAANNQYPIELPREAGTGQACIQTDIYSIAYLSTIVRSSDPCAPAEPEIPIIAHCLKPFPAWRPNAVQVLRALKPDDQESATDPGVRDIPSTTPNCALRDTPKSDSKFYGLMNKAVKFAADYISACRQTSRQTDETVMLHHGDPANIPSFVYPDEEL